jgi:Cysteine-rich secretory protein family
VIRARRRLTLAGSSVLLVAILATGLAAPVGAATADTLGSELMRLTNLDRTALGQPALAVDSTLVGFAQGLAWTCPGTTMVLAGRSVDMARRDYFSHSIKSCLKSDGTTYGSLDVMSVAFHYATPRGENIAWNRGYSISDTASYGTGCPLGAVGTDPTSGCAGATSTILSVAIAQRGFMNSSGHRSNLLADYDRFGCAAAVAADTGVYYTCVFSLGGPTSVVTDAVLPRVTSETGNGHAYPRSHVRGFSATFSDNDGLRAGSVYLDGVRIKSWAFDGSIRSYRAYVSISAGRMRSGYHTLIWHSVDNAGHVSTYADGKVRFRAY